MNHYLVFAAIASVGLGGVAFGFIMLIRQERRQRRDLRARFNREVTESICRNVASYTKWRRGYILRWVGKDPAATHRGSWDDEPEGGP